MGTNPLAEPSPPCSILPEPAGAQDSAAMAAGTQGAAWEAPPAGLATAAVMAACPVATSAVAVEAVAACLEAAPAAEAEAASGDASAAVPPAVAAAVVAVDKARGTAAVLAAAEASRHARGRELGTRSLACPLEQMRGGLEWLYKVFVFVQSCLEACVPAPCF